MPLIILGLLLVAALSVYIVISEHPQWFVKKQEKDAENDEDSPSVIYLSGQVEEQKQEKDDE